MHGNNISIRHGLRTNQRCVSLVIYLHDAICLTYFAWRLFNENFLVSYIYCFISFYIISIVSFCFKYLLFHMEGNIWRHNRFLSFLAKNLINGKLIFQNIISSRIDVITDRLTESLLNGCK